YVLVTAHDPGIGFTGEADVGHGDSGSKVSVFLGGNGDRALHASSFDVVCRGDPPPFVRPCVRIGARDRRVRPSAPPGCNPQTGGAGRKTRRLVKKRRVMFSGETESEQR